MGDRPHILVIDDDDRIRQLVTRYLQEHDFVALTAANAREGRALLERLVFDALIVDIMMPGESGLSFTEDLRTRGQNIPVLMLTALGEPRDRIAGLETGADDYLPKPFDPQELVLRLKAILRRVGSPDTRPSQFRVGRWVYDVEQACLKDVESDETLSLTTTESNLLQALARYAGEVVSREMLAELCDLDAGERTIDVQVTRLRRKIEEDPKAPRALHTVRGKGYMLRVGDL
jgi:two-component system phosphate regulon response regulator OmpR